MTQFSGPALQVYNQRARSLYHPLIDQPMANLATPQGIQEYFSDTEFSVASVVPLSGGHANFTYRGTLSTPLEGDAGGKTAIYKYTAPYVAAMKDMEYDPIRSVGLLISQNGCSLIVSSILSIKFSHPSRPLKSLRSKSRLQRRTITTQINMSLSQKTLD